MRSVERQDEALAAARRKRIDPVDIAGRIRQDFASGNFTVLRGQCMYEFTMGDTVLRCGNTPCAVNKLAERYEQ